MSQVQEEPVDQGAGRSFYGSASAYNDRKGKITQSCNVLPERFLVKNGTADPSAGVVQLRED